MCGKMFVKSISDTKKKVIDIPERLGVYFKLGLRFVLRQGREHKQMSKNWKKMGMGSIGKGEWGTRNPWNNNVRVVSLKHPFEFLVWVARTK